MVLMDADQVNGFLDWALKTMQIYEDNDKNNKNSIVFFLQNLLILKTNATFYLPKLCIWNQF